MDIAQLSTGSLVWTPLLVPSAGNVEGPVVSDISILFFYDKHEVVTSRLRDKL